MSKKSHYGISLAAGGLAVILAVLFLLSLYNLSCKSIEKGVLPDLSGSAIYSLSPIISAPEPADESFGLSGSYTKRSCSLSLPAEAFSAGEAAAPCLYVPNGSVSALLINGQLYTPEYGCEYLICILQNCVEYDGDRAVFDIGIYSRSDRAPSSDALLYLGQHSRIVSLVSAGSFQRFFVIGISFMIVFYSLSLYRGKKTEKYLLFLAVYAYTTTARTLWNAVPVLKAVPFANILLCGTIGLPGVSQTVSYYVSYIVIKAIIAGLRYMLLKEFVPVRLGKQPYWKVIPLLLTILLPFCFFGHGYVASQVFILTIHFIEFLLLIRGCGKSRRMCNLLMMALGITVALRISDLLYTCCMVSHGMIEASVKLQGITEVFYALAFVSVINLKFAGKYREADELALSLEEINRSLESKVRERTEELTQSNDKLSAAYKQLHDIQVQKDEFMTNIIHNLKTPLFSLYGYADMAMDELEDAPELARKHLQEINKNTNYARQLIEKLFLCMRLEDGKVKYQPVPFSAELLLQQLESTGSAAAEAAGIKLKLPPPDEELMLVADMLYLRQALQNILDNAIRHSYPDSEICIAAEGVQDADFGPAVCISIKDRGEGIAPEEIPLIFGRYYSNGKKGASSSGLGLTITKGIVEQNGGRIEVSSELNSGTEFRIFFPLQNK